METAAAPELIVKLKRVYGRERFYPWNDTAETLIRVMQKKTFTKRQLMLYKEGGWKIQVIQDEYAL